ncbi:uncharacterized protein LOC126750305 [Anthonomus grandis grandis]|uniref:uncharacterized protein LOC126750305 n=1 Tax=Anthonomus grandis grandis TaxID=2921223 RepID=UPI002165071E|nr:uncharacterized protein LOC126750305 [Anthonomus grandis grandis]
MEFSKRTVAVILYLHCTIVASSPVIPSTRHALCDVTMEDQNLPDQSDCSKYFRCVYGTLVPKICPEKMLFNPGIGNCDLFYNVDCSTARRLDRDEEKTVAELEGVRSTTFRKVKEFVDDTSTVISRFVYIPHEEYVNAYYKIENGKRSLLYCEEGMVFSVELEICVKM